MSKLYRKSTFDNDTINGEINYLLIDVIMIGKENSCFVVKNCIT